MKTIEKRVVAISSKLVAVQKKSLGNRLFSGFQDLWFLFKLLFAKLLCGVFSWFLQQEAGSFVWFLPVAWIRGGLYCHFVVSTITVSSP